MLQPGTIISNRYEIIEHIGAGGMADVYRAKDHRLSRYVAVKVLKEEFSTDKTFVKKFRAEAQAAAGLSHPNIVNVYDVGEEEGLYYIVMELVEGITLKEFIARRGKLSVQESLGIAIQIAQGLRAAHAKHIIHRDIKPQNIIISKDGSAKVTDFGIAKAVTSNTITTNAVGSVHYISPEQARGGYSDEKSDIYSLAVTLYEMLTGRVPFVGENTVAVALKHIQEEAVPLRQIDPSIPESVEKIVMKCMQKKPERRYQNADALIADLKHALVRPQDDFVNLAPQLDSNSPTVVLTPEQLEHIKGAVRDPELDEEDRDLQMKNDSRNTGRNASSGSRNSGGNYRSTGNRQSSSNRRNDDDRDDGDIDPKLEKLMVGGGIAVAVILGLIVVFLIGKALGIFSFGKSGTTTPAANNTTAVENTANETEKVENKVIPKVVGSTQDDATAALQKLGFTVEVVQGQSDVYDVGTVIAVSPNEGEPAEVGSTVTITVCSEGESITMPDFTNQSSDDVTTALTQLGLKVEVKHDYDDTIEEGNVISTNPAKDATVKKGDTVTITVSQGKETAATLVPDLSGMTKSEAESALGQANLTTGDVSSTYSSSVPEGQVVSQSIAKNTKVDEGTAVGFVLSKGPEKVASYYGTLSISNDYNPFENQEDEGTITLMLTQGSTTTKVYESVLTYDEFASALASLKIQGTSAGKGTVKMYLDDVECPGSWLVTFTEE